MKPEVLSKFIHDHLGNNKQAVADNDSHASAHERTIITIDQQRSYKMHQMLLAERRKHEDFEATIFIHKDSAEEPNDFDIP